VLCLVLLREPTLWMASSTLAPTLITENRICGGELSVDHCCPDANNNRNLGILIAYIVVFFAVYLLAAEYITTNKSKGEVLVFGRSNATASTSKKAADEETLRPDNVPPQNEKTTASQKTTTLAQGNIFHWQDVCYDITIKGQPRRILDGVDGWVKPGTLTALMVGS